MADEARNHDRILAEARQSLADQRSGGRRRLPPIGRGSAEVHRKNLM